MFWELPAGAPAAGPVHIPSGVRVSDLGAHTPGWLSPPSNFAATLGAGGSVSGGRAHAGADSTPRRAGLQVCLGDRNITPTFRKRMLGSERPTSKLALTGHFLHSLGSAGAQGVRPSLGAQAPRWACPGHEWTIGPEAGEPRTEQNSSVKFRKVLEGSRGPRRSLGALDSTSGHPAYGPRSPRFTPLILQTHTGQPSCSWGRWSCSLSCPL